MNLEYAYSFTAKNRSKEIVRGVVYAADSDVAYIKLNQMGYIPSDVPRINVPYSIRNFLSKEFNRKDLARFYASMSKRLKNGRPIPEGLEHAMEFVDDPKLKQALIMMRQYVMEGNSMATAMKMAGFPLRDVEVIRSTSEAGRSADSMERISQELLRAEKLKNSIMSMLRMPVIVMFIMYAAFYGVLVFIAPTMMKFFKQALSKVSLPPYADYFYKFSDLFRSNLTLSTTLYVLALVGLIVFVRSKYFLTFVSKIKLVQTITEKTEMANLWTSFAMLYEAGISIEATCKLLAQAARTPSAQDNFLNMHRLIRSGLRLSQAVERAGFPEYIKRGLLAAESGSDIAGGVDDMCNDLTQDVVDMTEKLKDFTQILTVGLLSFFVLLFFMVSYYPIISATMSQL